MSASMDAFTHEEQRAYIKIEFYRGTKTDTIFEVLQNVCGIQAVGRTTVFRWIAAFKNGRQSVKDEHRSGRKIEVTDKYYVEKVKEIIDTDRRYTCENIAAEVGISTGSVYVILTSRLGMRKISARWVPHCLTSVQIQRRVEVAEQLLARYEIEGETFLNRVVAIDETWIRSYEPELKRQSAEWHTPASPRPAKFRRKQGHLKMMMIFAYDTKGILSSHRVPIGQTVNQEYYRYFLSKVLRPAIRKKRPGLLEVTPCLLHDNASSHLASRVTSLLSSYEWEVLPHPAYSPDMSPPDFDLFAKLKEPMRGVRFDDLEELEQAVADQVRHMNLRCLATGVAKLSARWKSVIEKKGCYIEGM